MSEPTPVPAAACFRTGLCARCRAVVRVLKTEAGTHLALDLEPRPDGTVRILPDGEAFAMTADELSQTPPEEAGPLYRPHDCDRPQPDPGVPAACHYCDRPAAYLCDFPAGGPGATCDRPLCEAHRVRRGGGIARGSGRKPCCRPFSIDYCPDHAGAPVAEARGARPLGVTESPRPAPRVTPASVLTALRAHGFVVAVEAGRVAVSPPDRLTPGLAGAVARHDRALLVELAWEASAPALPAPPPAGPDAEAASDLSGAQAREDWLAGVRRHDHRDRPMYADDPWTW